MDEMRPEYTIEKATTIDKLEDLIGLEKTAIH